MQKKEKKELMKQKELDYIENRIRDSKLIKVPEWKNSLMGVSQGVLQSLIAILLVKKHLVGTCWYFVTNDGRKIHQISSNVVIMGPECFRGRELLENVADNKKEVNLVGSLYYIKAVVVLNNVRFEQLMEKNQSKQNVPIRGTSPLIQEVYVYFRLNNICVNDNHNIETITTETTDIRTGLSIEVNVFHCKDCNKFFINHEAVQYYITRGVYPSLKFTMLGESNDRNLRATSALMTYGYNVKDNELTECDRHRILSWIIDAGLLSKEDIIKDLQFKVSYNGKKTGNEKSKKKWKKDIKFISQYIKGNTISMNAIFERKK